MGPSSSRTPRPPGPAWTEATSSSCARARGWRSSPSRARTRWSDPGSASWPATRTRPGSGPDAPTPSSSTRRTASTRARSSTRSATELGAEYDLVIDTPESTKDFAFSQLRGFFSLAYVILIAAAVAGLLGLANTLAVSVLARTHEIGVLRSVGTLRRQIRQMVLVEAITLALVAFVLAVPLGLLLTWARPRRSGGRSAHRSSSPCRGGSSCRCSS